MENNSKGDTAIPHTHINMIEKNSQYQGLSQPQMRREMETPVIVKSINRGITSMRDDAIQQAVDRTPQVVPNREAFNAIYPTHRAYYDDKRFFVFDKNYYDMQKELIKTFEQAVDSSFTNHKVKAQNNGRINNIKDVEEIKNKNLNVNFDNIPRVKLPYITI